MAAPVLAAWAAAFHAAEARSRAGDAGSFALMSCQDATRLEAFAGNNAVADVLGARLTRGWDRKVALVGTAAKEVKKEFNRRRDLPAAS